MYNAVTTWGALESHSTQTIITPSQATSHITYCLDSSSLIAFTGVSLPC